MFQIKNLKNTIEDWGWYMDYSYNNIHIMIKASKTNCLVEKLMGFMSY